MPIIYESAIKNAAEKCETAIEEMRTIADIYGTEDDRTKLNEFDLEEEATEYLSEIIDAHDLTNSIIAAYMHTTLSVLETMDFAEELSITGEVYVNCDDSHLCFEYNGDTREFYEGELTALVNASFADTYSLPFYEMISEYLESKYGINDNDYTYGDFTADLEYDNVVSTEDIRDTVQNDKLTDTVIAYLDDIGKEMKQTKENVKNAVIHEK